MRIARARKVLPQLAAGRDDDRPCMPIANEGQVMLQPRRLAIQIYDKRGNFKKNIEGPG